MEPGPHPDTLPELTGSQRVAYIALLATAMKQDLVHQETISQARSSISDEHARQVLAFEEHKISRRIQQAVARAHDRQWIADADLLQVGPIWAAAAAIADTDPAAAAALRNCEDRLYVLHPYAMDYYDMCRENGARPLAAMLEVAPMFGRPAHVQASDMTAPHPQPVRIADPVERAEYQVRQLAQRLQDRARASGRLQFERQELILILEAVSDLPGNLIETIAREAEDKPRPASGPARQAADSFPDHGHHAASAADGAERQMQPAAHTTATTADARLRPGMP